MKTQYVLTKPDAFLKFRTKVSRLVSVPFVAVLLLAAGNGQGATYSWTPTAVGTNNWDDSGSQNNWSSGFPNAIGDVANLTNDITGAQTINLNQAITVGKINIGDSTASFNAFTVQNGAGGSLTFNNGGSGAQINKTGASTAGVI